MCNTSGCYMNNKLKILFVSKIFTCQKPTSHYVQQNTHIFMFEIILSSLLLFNFQRLVVLCIHYWAGRIFSHLIRLTWPCGFRWQGSHMLITPILTDKQSHKHLVHWMLLQCLLVIRFIHCFCWTMFMRKRIWILAKCSVSYTPFTACLKCLGMTDRPSIMT